MKNSRSKAGKKRKRVATEELYPEVLALLRGEDLWAGKRRWRPNANQRVYGCGRPANFAYAQPYYDLHAVARSKYWKKLNKGGIGPVIQFKHLHVYFDGLYWRI